MSDCHDTSRRRNLHAPWRSDYVTGLSEPQEGCFLCRARDGAGQERANLLLWRTGHSVVVLNRFPYTGGHLLIAPREHVPTLEGMGEPALLEMMTLARDSQKLLDAVVGAEGYNLGVNLGRAAGAGLPGHVHLHVVPRWSGDTNFLSVLGDVRVIPQSLEALYDQLQAAAGDLGLPKALHER